MTVSVELARVDQAAQLVSRYNFLTSVGIEPEVRAHLTDREMELIAVYSETLADVSLWTLADLLLEIQERCRKVMPSKREFLKQRNQLWEQLIRNACKREWNLHTAYNICRTAEQYPFTTRRHTDSISFEHHRLLCVIPRDGREEWFDRIEAERWTTAKLRYELYAESLAIDPDEPRPERRIKIEILGIGKAVIRTPEGNIVASSDSDIELRWDDEDA